MVKRMVLMTGCMVAIARVFVVLEISWPCLGL